MREYGSSVRCRCSDEYFGLQINRTKSRSTNHANFGYSDGLSSNHPATKSLVDKKNKLMTGMLAWESEQKTQQYKHNDACNPLNRSRNIGLSIKCRSGFCRSKRNGGGNDKEAVDSDLGVPTRT